MTTALAANSTPIYDALEEVTLELIFTDERYGRPLKEWWVTYLADSWLPNSAGVIYLSERPDGRYACIDGWHRVNAARRLKIKTLPARVFRGLSPEEEAHLFDDYNRLRRPPTPVEIFRVRLFYGEAAAVAISKVIEDLGLQIAQTGGHTSPKHVKAVASLDQIYRADRSAGLRRVLGIIKESWPLEEGAYSVWALNGLAAFLRRYPDADRNRIISRLAKLGPNGMVGRSRQVQQALGIPAQGAWGMALWGEYNKGLRNKLMEWSTKKFSEKGREMLSQRRSRQEPAS